MSAPNVIIKYAVDHIVEEINSGTEPTAAVTKWAKELKLNQNFIKRACEVVNVALHYSHFKKNANAKEVDFPIADSDQAVRAIFGTKEKTASELKSEWFPVSGNVEEGINFNKLNSLAFKKAYDQIVDTTENYEYFPLSALGVCEKSAAYFDRLEKKLDDLKSKQAGASYDINHNFSNLMQKFARDNNYRASFAEFENQAYGVHGERAKSYIDLLYKTSEIKEERGALEKKAEAGNAKPELYILNKLLKAASDFNELTKEIDETEREYVESKNYVTEMYHKYAESKVGKKTGPVVVQATVEKSPPAQPNSYFEADPVLEAAKPKMKEYEELDETVLTDGQKRLPHALKKAIISRKKQKTAELDPVIKEAFLTDVAKGIGELAEGEGKPGSQAVHMSDKDNLERRLMLQEVMTFDPVLSKTPPQQIADSYRTLLRVAPELTREKEIMRASLRQLTQSEGGLSAFDAKGYIDTNSALMKQQRGDEDNG